MFTARQIKKYKSDLHCPYCDAGYCDYTDPTYESETIMTVVCTCNNPSCGKIWTEVWNLKTIEKIGD